MNPPEQLTDSSARLATTRHGTCWLWIALILELLLLLTLNRFGDFFVPGNATRFVPIAVLAGICYLLAICRFNKVGAALHSPLLWGGAIAFRLVVLFMPPGDDLWRYLWEGKIQLHGFNPYLLNPDASALAPLRESWWNSINHRDYAAIYPPGIEWIFARLAGAASIYSLPVELWSLCYKALFTLADLATISLLLKLNTGSGRFRATAWYAWNPAVILAFAGAGHYDSLMLLPLTASMLLLHRANPLGTCKPAWTWAFLSAVLLGVAISIKTIPILLLPVWAFALGWRSIVLAVSAAIPLAMTVPYGGLEVVTKSFRAFTNVARFNDLIWWAVDWLIWPNPAQQNGRYTRILLLTVALLAFLFRKEWRRGALWVVGAALILSPVLHPWYVCWILPFASWRKTPEWFVFSISVMLAFLAWDNTCFGPAWGEPALWLRELMVLPPLILLGARIRMRTCLEAS